MNKKIVSICILFITIISACKKDKQQKTDVYLVGAKYTTGDEKIATLWKNNEETELTGTLQYAIATCITTENNDIYIGGYTIDNPDEETIAKYWKNGVETSLSDGNYTTIVSAIAVSNGDVYCAGYETASNGKKIATYWKNGVAHNLTLNNNDGEVKRIKVKNGNVYCAGYKINTAGNYEARYWINNTSYTLAENAEANSILLVGDDIYIAGSIDNVDDTPIATYWKNGIPISITDGNYPAWSTDLFMDGNTLYVSFDELIAGNQVAKYWKNGAITILSPEDETYSTSAIYVANNDVYVCGYTQGLCQYWKNGTLTKVNNSNISGVVNDVLIVKK